MDLVERIVEWLRMQVHTTATKGLVVGMSGGIDSSVAAVLSKRACRDDMLGLIMPCFSNERDKEYALKIAQKFDIPTKIIYLDEIFTQLFRQLEGEESYAGKENTPTLTNIKSRLRMVCLYYFANKLNYLVVGTGNKSELTVGYFTKYGDGAADILPLGGLLKTQVWELAKELGIPTEIIERVPTAGLYEGQTDEAEIGVSYKELDGIIQAIESKNLQNYNIGLVNKIKEKINATEHKRKLPAVFLP